MTPIANQAEYDGWNGDRGRRWVSDPDRRDQVMVPVADALFAAADLVSGEAVLDIGCGCGATTLAAARSVSPHGSVHGIDLSAPMLDVARQRVEAAALTNVTLQQADAQTDTLVSSAHDAAISRFGTMFFDDPIAAFANILTSLRSGGRLCVATWQPLAGNDWLTIPGAALLRYGQLPDTGGTAPGMFAQSDPDVVADVLSRAGYRDVDVRPVTVSLRLGGDAAEATAHLADTGVGRAVLATIPADQQPEALAAVTALLADLADSSGVHLDAGILLTTATKAR